MAFTLCAKETPEKPAVIYIKKCNKTVCKQKYNNSIYNYVEGLFVLYMLEKLQRSDLLIETNHRFISPAGAVCHIPACSLSRFSVMN